MTTPLNDTKFNRELVIRDNTDYLEGRAAGLHKTLSELEPSDYQDAWRFMKCVNCGGGISALNVKYFNNNGSLVKCYNCQKK